MRKRRFGQFAGAVVLGLCLFGGALIHASPSGWTIYCCPVTGNLLADDGYGQYPAVPFSNGWLVTTNPTMSAVYVDSTYAVDLTSTTCTGGGPGGAAMLTAGQALALGAGQGFLWRSYPFSGYQSGDKNLINTLGYQAPEEEAPWTVGYAATYSEREYDVVAGIPNADAEIRSLRQMLTLFGGGERLQFIADVSSEEADGRGDFDGLGYDRLVLNLFPAYVLCSEAENGFSLALVGKLGASRITYEYDPGVDDADHVMYGLGFSAAKSTDVGVFGCSYVYHTTQNIDGDDELTGTSRINAHGLGAMYMLELTESVYTRARLTYTRTLELPGDQDPDYLAGLLEVGWHRDAWSVSLSGSRSLFMNDATNWSVEVGAGYRF